MVVKNFKQFLIEDEASRLALIKSLQILSAPSNKKLSDKEILNFAKRSHAFVKFPSSPLHLSAEQDLLNMGQIPLQQIIAHPKVNALYKQRARLRLSTIAEDVKDRCWDGYKPTPGKKPYEKGSCMKEDDIQEDSEYDGKKVTLNKPFRTPDGPKKFAVYVKNDKGNVVKVTFGDPNMEIKRDDTERRASYRARHNCSDPGPKWKANYWSCKMWADKPVSKIIEESNKFNFVPGVKTPVFNLLSPTKEFYGLIGDTPEIALKNKFDDEQYKNVEVKRHPIIKTVFIVNYIKNNIKQVEYFELV
jgi:hypothetical protein